MVSVFVVCDIMLSVLMVSVFVLCDIMLSVIIHCVVMLSVAMTFNKSDIVV
jgi:hypothetical protein